MSKYFLFVFMRNDNNDMLESNDAFKIFHRLSRSFQTEKYGVQFIKIDK